MPHFLEDPQAIAKFEARYQPFIADYARLIERTWMLGEKIQSRVMVESFLTERAARLAELQQALAAAGLSWALLQEYVEQHNYQLAEEKI